MRNFPSFVLLSFSYNGQWNDNDISMHVNTHKGQFINHPQVTVGVMGAKHEALALVCQNSWDF